MAVVINEVEVETQPETPSPPAVLEQVQSARGTAPQDPVKQVQKILRVQYQRNHRLEAY